MIEAAFAFKAVSVLGGVFSERATKTRQAYTMFRLSDHIGVGKHGYHAGHEDLEDALQGALVDL